MAFKFNVGPPGFPIRDCPIIIIPHVVIEGLDTPASVSITDVQQLTSYNRIDASITTIAVPGSPNVWMPPKVPFQLKDDSTINRIDSLAPTITALGRPNLWTPPEDTSQFTQNTTTEWRRGTALAEPVKPNASGLPNDQFQYRQGPNIAISSSPNMKVPLIYRPRYKPGATTGSYIHKIQFICQKPDSSLEQLFRALDVSHPSFDISSIDIVTDPNNIQTLLSLIKPPRKRGSGRQNFTMHVEVTKNTAIFHSPEDPSSDSTYNMSNFKDYRGFFEKKCTSCLIRGSNDHHRVLSYRLGGLNFMVRHKADGYVSVSGDTQLSPQPMGRMASDMYTVVKSHGKSYGPPPTAEELHRQRRESAKFEIRKEGQDIPLSSTLTIKTAKAHHPYTLEDVAAELWATQTPNLVRAYYGYEGEFDVPEVEDVADKIKIWEDKNQDDLRVLVALMGRIRDVARDNGGRVKVWYNAIEDELALFKLDGDKMLPKDFYGRWEGKRADQQGDAMGESRVEQADKETSIEDENAIQEALMKRNIFLTSNLRL